MLATVFFFVVSLVMSLYSPPLFSLGYRLQKKKKYRPSARTFHGSVARIL